MPRNYIKPITAAHVSKILPVSNPKIHTADLVVTYLLPKEDSNIKWLSLKTPVWYAKDEQMLRPEKNKKDFKKSGNCH